MLLLEDPYLWARDVAGVLLRCMTDTLFTFVCLARKGTTRDFRDFVDFGEGQNRLLMLHLQDTYPEVRSLEGSSALDLEERFSVLPEFIDIELGHWTKQNVRQLARAAGLEHVYRLVYAPPSSDVHGSWLSIKNSHLTFCAEPLHRYHHLPQIAEPPIFVNVIETAKQLYEEARAVAVAELGYPASESLPSFLDLISPTGDAA